MTRRRTQKVSDERRVAGLIGQPVRLSGFILELLGEEQRLVVLDAWKSNEMIFALVIDEDGIVSKIEGKNDLIFETYEVME